MTPIPLVVAVEDPLSEALIRKTLTDFGDKYQIQNCLCAGGFGPIKKKIRNYNHAARTQPFLVVTDLDDAPCPIHLMQNWLPEPRRANLLFRVAVRESEAWLLADREAVAGFLGFSVQLLPREPDSLPDPKAFLLDTIRQKCRRRALKEAILPPAGATSTVGPDYNGEWSRFIAAHWRPEVAHDGSTSYRRAYRCLQTFSPSREFS